MITQVIDAAKLVTLPGNTRAEANAANDQGRVDDAFPMDHMMLQLKRGAAQEQALQAYIDSLHDSSSPNFHQWISAEQFGQQWGSDVRDIAKISKWLEGAGFTINTVYPSGMSIDFSGNAGQVAKTFHTEIHNLSVGGVQHFANMSDPMIPAALAPAVAGIVSLHNFHPHANLRPKRNYTASVNGSTYQLMTPADLATIYDLNAAFAAGYTGQGQTIAVIEDSDLYSAADWATFRSTFGLSSYTSGTLNTIHPAPTSGRTNCPDPGVPSGGDDGEAIIDAEWATAAAPNAAIQVAACSSSTTDGLYIAIQNLVNSKTPPQIISLSYGECEANNGSASNNSYNSIFQQAVTAGISVFVSSGDSGPASCDAGTTTATHGVGVSGLSSTPYNVAVGGTDFIDSYQNTNKNYWSATNTATYGSALSYIPEIPWNDSCAGSLLSKYEGFSLSYGTNGFCGSAYALQNQFVGFSLGGGGGGPSGCATGAPSSSQIVSGTCAGWPKPTWQTGVTGIPADGVRDTPDVSMFASDGSLWGHLYLACFSDPNNGGTACTGAPVNWFGAGGTSFAAPIMAGIQAMVNQKLGSAQGNPNPVYYKLAASSVASSVFHAISKGDNVQNCSGEVNCFGIAFEARGRSATPTTFVGNGAQSTTSSTYTPAFAANGAYNMATGIGSVDAYNLILNWTKGQ